VIDVHRRARHHVLIVQISHHANDAPGRSADVDEFHDRIGPHEVVVDGIPVRKHSLGHALAYNDDSLPIFPIVVVEITAGDDGDAERGEKSGRYRAELRAGILFASGTDVAIRGELKARTEGARVAPRDHGADGNAIRAGKGCDLPHRLFVEALDLIVGAPVFIYRHVQREDVVHIEAGANVL
jgi:hypothetical protein